MPSAQTAPMAKSMSPPAAAALDESSMPKEATPLVTARRESSSSEVVPSAPSTVEAAPSSPSQMMGKQASTRDRSVTPSAEGAGEGMASASSAKFRKMGEQGVRDQVSPQAEQDHAAHSSAASAPVAMMPAGEEVTQDYS